MINQAVSMNAEALDFARLHELPLQKMKNIADVKVNVVKSPEEARKHYESASTPEEKKIKKTADEFVSILYGMLIREMDKTVDRTGFLDGGKTEEMFRSFVYDEYAKEASQQRGSILNHKVYEMLYNANAKIKDK